MKKILTVLVCLFFSYHSLIAQAYTKEGEKIGVSYSQSSIWRVDVGFNNYLENGNFATNNAYTLNNFGSRYISAMGGYAFGLYKNSVVLNTGLAISAHNFMLQGSRYIRRDATSNEVLFANHETEFQQTLEKSKLVVCYLDIPLSLRINIGGNQQLDKIALDLGGYVGYRFASYTSLKPEGMSRKQRNHDGYNLNNWRYGLEAALGIGGVQLFIRQDLNTMFNAQQRPALNILYFGLRIWGSEFL
ncbi:MAG: hypothetical protein JJT94_08525 [Bernardetiaceae bacterium]|nr:hypothetical protein [Bernardetiaceae bacterium]